MNIISKFRKFEIKIVPIRYQTTIRVNRLPGTRQNMAVKKEFPHFGCLILKYT